MAPVLSTGAFYALGTRRARRSSDDSSKRAGERIEITRGRGDAEFFRGHRPSDTFLAETTSSRIKERVEAAVIAGAEVGSVCRCLG